MSTNNFAPSSDALPEPALEEADSLATTESTVNGIRQLVTDDIKFIYPPGTPNRNGEITSQYGQRISKEVKEHDQTYGLDSSVHEKSKMNQLMHFSKEVVQSSCSRPKEFPDWKLLSQLKTLKTRAEIGLGNNYKAVEEVVSLIQHEQFNLTILQKKKEALEEKLEAEKRNINAQIYLINQQRIIEATENKATRHWIARCSMLKWLTENTEVFKDAAVEEMRLFFNLRTVEMVDAIQPPEDFGGGLHAYLLNTLAFMKVLGYGQNPWFKNRFPGGFRFDPQNPTTGDLIYTLKLYLGFLSDTAVLKGRVVLGNASAPAEIACPTIPEIPIEDDDDEELQREKERGEELREQLKRQLEKITEKTNAKRRKYG